MDPPPAVVAASAAAASEPQPAMVKMDRELVLGHLGEGGAENGRAGLRVSLWDFAGQEVFYVLHHLYLTRFAAYAVLFDMQVRPKPQGSFSTRPKSLHIYVASHD